MEVFIFVFSQLNKEFLSFLETNNINEDLKILDEHNFNKNTDHIYTEIEQKIKIFFKKHQNGLQKLVERILNKYKALIIENESLKNLYQDLNNQVMI